MAGVSSCSPSCPPFADRLIAVRGELVRFCRRLCFGDEAEAEDLAQETLLAAWRQRATIEERFHPGKERASLARWCLRVAARKRSRIVARRAKEPAMVSLDVAPEQVMSGDFRKDVAGEIHVAEILGRLPAGQAICLRHMMEGCPLEEAARLAGISSKAARTMKESVAAWILDDATVEQMDGEKYSGRNNPADLELLSELGLLGDEG